MNLELIFPLLMTFITLIVVILHSIQSEKIIVKTLSLAFLNFALGLVIYFLHDYLIGLNPIFNDLYNYYVIFVYLFFLLMFFLSFKTAIYKSNHYHLFVKSIRESNWNAYYIVDKKERIRDISESLLKELNLEKEDVLGKKLFNIFNKTIRFIKFNDTAIDNKQLENYYKEYRKIAKIGDSETEELIFNNYEGTETVLKVILQPVFVMGRYMGRMIVGEIKTDFDMLKVEKKLSTSMTELESIREKFIATLEISKEGLFSIDLDDKSIWVSDSLRRILELESNMINLEDFRKMIEPSDLVSYLGVLSNLSITNENYRVRYRILKNNNYIWVEEHGKRIFADKHTSTIMGSINLVPVKHFRASNIPELDNILDSDHLMVKLESLLANKNRFYLLIFELTNIPEINELHDWRVGNMIIANYIKQVENVYVTESGGIYRITGLKFAVIITDPSKLGMLKKQVSGIPNSLDTDITYGSIRLELKVHGGISISSEDGIINEHVYGAAEEALKLAKNPQVSHQVLFYQDIKS